MESYEKSGAVRTREHGLPRRKERSRARCSSSRSRSRPPATCSSRNRVLPKFGDRHPHPRRQSVRADPGNQEIMLEPAKLRGCIDTGGRLDDQSIARELARVAGEIRALDEERRRLIGRAQWESWVRCELLHTRRPPCSDILALCRTEPYGESRVRFYNRCKIRVAVKEAVQ
jgi:hypothetical protein